MSFYLLIINVITAAVLSIAINWIMLRYAHKLSIKNDTSSERWASDYKPGIGGLSFFIIFLLASAFYPNTMPETTILRGFLTAASLAFFIGWYDDTFVLRPIYKLFGQFVCAAFLVFSGSIIHASGVYFLDVFFTLCWIVAIMNSINMIDNMDAIASSISISILIAAIIVMHYTGNYTSISPYFIACMIGALIGFVKWNWYPSKIMMGDTGSQFLGVLLATVSISLFWKFRILDGRSLQVKQWLFPYLVFLTPFIDTVTVVFRRTIRGQGFWVGGRDHITHILVYFGLSQRAVAWVVIGSSLVNILLGWYMLHLMENWKYWYSILFALYMFIVFIFMQIIYVRASYKMNIK